MKSSFHFGSFLFGDETFIPVKKVSNKENSDFGFDNFIQVFNYLDEQA